MGTYKEPRVPKGAPVDGEHDVWLDGGSVKWGHWNAATSAWVVDATADSSGLIGEKGACGDKGPTGDEGPPCPTGGNADTLDGYHAADILGSGDQWHIVGDSGEVGFYNTDFEQTSDAGATKLRYRKDGRLVTVIGQCQSTTDSGGYIFFQFPEAYRPITIFENIWDGMMKSQVGHDGYLSIPEGSFPEDTKINFSFIFSV